MKCRFSKLRITMLLTGVLSIPQLSAAPVTVQAKTVSQIVNGIRLANNGDVPVIINVAPGHYQLTGQFNSAFGVSHLPPIRKVVQLVGTGSDPAATVLDGGGGGGRIFTVVSGGQLSARNLTVTGGFAADEGSTDRNVNSGGAAASFSGYLRFDDC